MSTKLWVVRICIALSVMAMLNLSTSVFVWWIRIRRFEFSTHWELISLYVLLYVISGMLLGLRAEAFLNLRNVRFNPFAFIVLGVIPIISLVLFVGVVAGYWSYRFLLLLPDLMSFGAIISPIWLGAALGKALYIRE